MKVLGVIPARYESTRFPGKPLIDLLGKTMIQRVYERASLGVQDVVVATDDRRIYDEVMSFGGKVVMTRSDHSTGTNRCLEAFQIWKEESGREYDIVINIQGDEPLLDPLSLTTLIQPFSKGNCSMATLVMPVVHSADLNSSNNVFVTMSKQGKALYFSRHPIPFVRGVEKSDWLNHAQFYRHIGLYAFSPQALEEFALMEMGKLETAESLEQLRWLEAGNTIFCSVVNEVSVSVDTPEDAEAVRTLLKGEE